MEEQFKYIVELAKQFKPYSVNSNELYKALNSLNEDVIQSIYEEYGDIDANFQPINLIRAEVARNLLKKVEVSEKLVEEIKNKIRIKDLSYFKHLPDKFLKELKNYPIGKRDLFANWQKPWSIFHTFFYRDKVKEKVQLFLKQIGNRLIEDLELKDYQNHCVDFYGSSNFGSESCWIALYPFQKESHQHSYQFFIKLSDVPEAGRMAGFAINDPKDDILTKVNSYSEALKVLIEQKQEIISLNNSIRDFYKISPGSQAILWEKFFQEGIAAISYKAEIPFDISDISSREELNEKAGLSRDSMSNKTWDLWLFKKAKVGDVIFANKGTNTCIGIGIIQSEYYFDKSEEYPHRKKVKWITDKVYQYKANSLKNYKTIFRPDTFTPTKVWKFLLDEYIRLYPELVKVFEENGISYTKTNSDEKQQIEEESKEINFWWLNANPSIWSISSLKEGEIKKYTSVNEKGNKRRIYKHFQNVQPGDLMIGYESSPVKQVKAIFEITKGLHISEDNVEVIEFQMIEKLEVPIDWNDLHNDPGLKDCEVFKNNQGSLFKLTEDEYDIIRNIIDNKNILMERILNETKLKKYDYENDPDKPFLSTAEFQQIILLLKRKKNIILQGPPGVGKTFLARKIAYAMMGSENDAQINMVQFHQSYSYEDFIQGLRPSKRGFELKNGIFYNFCKLAVAHPDRDFFFIIDEINRGNLSKIFGELLMLIESDKRGEKYKIKLTYAEDETDTFFVPQNLYIIGTMNTADRSLAIVDYALRRRFAFVTLQPTYNGSFRKFLESKGVSEKLIEHICSSVQKVNHQIINDINLGAGFQIGHSYFCSIENNMDVNQWYNDVLLYEIQPYLEEIWFDNPDNVNAMINILKR